MASAVRIGLVGCGPWGRHILRDLRSLGCVVPVMARSPGSVANARDGGAERIVPRIAELGDLDGVVVATATSTHADVLDEVLNQYPRVPVFCEKPLTDNVQRAEVLVARAADHLFVMDKWRYHPGIIALRDVARSREFGDVIGLRTVRVAWGEAHADVDPVWTLTPHDLSIAIEILGDLPRPLAARADRHDGRMLGLSALLGDRPWLSVEVSARHVDDLREVQLFCETGVAVLSGGYARSIRLCSSSPMGPVRKPAVVERAIPDTMPLLAELDAFVSHVRGAGPPPRSSAADALRVVRCIAELRRLAGAEDATA